MAASSNYTKKREKPVFNHIGGSSKPQPVPPKQPSLNPGLASFSPVNMVYWGYWKSHDETLVTVSPTGATDAVGITGANTTTSTGTNPATAQEASNRPAVPISTLTSPKPPTSQSGDKIPPKSPGSSVFQVPPASQQSTKDMKMTKDKKTSAGATTSTTTTAGFTDQEIIQGVSGIVQAFKKSGWVDKAIISYFLTPGGLGYRQFPGITTELFVKAADGIMDVSSLVSGNKGGAGSATSGSSSGGFNTRGLV